MTHNFRVGDTVRHKHRGFIAEVVSINQDIINVMELENNESTPFYEPINFKDLEYIRSSTPINYKKEYHRLLEDNQRLDRQLCDAQASKETIHSFYRDDFYLKNRIIAFLFTVVAVESVILMWGVL